MHPKFVQNTAQPDNGKTACLAGHGADLRWQLAPYNGNTPKSGMAYLTRYQSWIQVGDITCQGQNVPMGSFLPNP
jgi:hypothetical protein